MTQFEDSLHAMKRLLDAVDETHWSQWIADDLVRWQSSRDTSHHLSAYGAMGSFNDVWICTANGHTVSEAQEPWANALFESLKSLCQFLAQKPSHAFTAGALGLGSASSSLQGWGCLECGYGEVTALDVENLIAQDVVPAMVARGSEAGSLFAVVDQVLACDIPNLQTIRDAIATGLHADGIALAEREGWMRPCPSCSGDNTAVYHWNLLGGDTPRFAPSADNLPMAGS